MDDARRANVRGRQKWAVRMGAQHKSHVMGALLTLLTSYSDAEGISYPSRRSLAADLYATDDPSDDQIRRISGLTRRARDLGLLDVIADSWESGQQTSNRYRLHFPDLSDAVEVPQAEVSTPGVEKDNLGPESHPHPGNDRQADPGYKSHPMKENSPKDNNDNETNHDGRTSSSLGASPQTPEPGCQEVRTLKGQAGVLGVPPETELLSRAKAVGLLVQTRSLPYGEPRWLWRRGRKSISHSEEEWLEIMGSDAGTTVYSRILDREAKLARAV
jgi:hypothetical protein